MMNDECRMSAAAEGGLSKPELRHNIVVYFTAFGVIALTSSFCDMSVLIPNLALKLDAPSWLAVFPGVAMTSVGYLPVVVMGWLLRPGASKKRAYGILCIPLYGALVMLGVSLCVTRNPAFLRVMIFAATLLYALFVGTIVLPFWEMLRRAISESVRGRTMGACSSLTSLIGLFSASAAAWMISTRSPLPWPVNYGVGLIIAGIGGYVSVFLLMMWHQGPPEGDPAAPRRAFGTFCRDLAAILRDDRAYRSFMIGASAAAMIAGVGAMLLIFGKTQRGLTDNHISILIAARPIIGIPAMIGFGFLADRIGARRVCAINTLFVLLAVIITPLCYGFAQILPQFLVCFGGFIYSFVLMEILNYSPKGRNQDYLSVYYLTAMIPGLTPLALTRLMDFSAGLSIALAGILALLAAVLFALPAPKRDKQGA